MPGSGSRRRQGAALLDVHIASHTPRLLNAVAPFHRALDDAEGADPKPGRVLLACSERARVFRRSASTAALAAQIANPIDWAAALEALVEAGAETFLDLGPGHALADMAHTAFAGVHSYAADASTASAVCATGSHRHDGKAVNDEAASICRHSVRRRFVRGGQILPPTIEGRKIMTMNRRIFSAAMVAGAAASLISTRGVAANAASDEGAQRRLRAWAIRRRFVLVRGDRTIAGARLQLHGRAKSSDNAV